MFILYCWTEEQRDYWQVVCESTRTLVKFYTRGILCKYDGAWSQQNLAVGCAINEIDLANDKHTS